jgi:multidrug efflux pump subunit AcrA (membrane-fusion protein)
MMRFADMSEFHQGYQFFMLRPSRTVSSFILVLAGIVCAAVIWVLLAKMDDIVKATALIRPVAAISSVKILSGGEVLQKNYAHDSYVQEGDLLLQIDVSSDMLELDNSKKLMERVEDTILLYNTLQETIRLTQNNASAKNEEAHIRSEAYLIEHRRLLGQIEEQRVKLEREKSMPDTLSVKQRIEDMERELEQVGLQFALWKNNQMIDTMNNLKTLLQNKENLERRLSKLEGEISLIPADYVMASESSPIFIVEANIREPWLISPKGEKMYLRPGIGAQGRIIIDQDTVMRMFLKKLDFINESYDLKALEEEK